MASPALIVLAMGYVGALSWAAYEWQRPVPISPPPAKTVPIAITEISLPATYIGEIDAFDEIVERPAFIAGRRPPPGDDPANANTQVEAVRGPPMDLSGIRLTAVVIDGDKPTALIENASGKTERLHVGGKIDKWEVDAIKDDRIVLAVNGNQQTLFVHRFDAPPPVTEKQRRPSRRPRVLPVPRQPHQPKQRSEQPNEEPTG